MKRRNGNLLWPDVQSIAGAKSTSMLGVWAALYSAVMISVLATYSIFASQKALQIIDAWSFIDAAIFSLIAGGIYKEKRFAALFGLLFFGYEKYDQFLRTGAIPGPILVGILFICYLHSTRALFSLRKLRITEAEGGRAAASHSNDTPEPTA